MNDELYHYGTKRHSGRYKWGSGEVPYQHEAWFLTRYNDLRKQGLTEIEIASALECYDSKGNPSSGELRRQVKIANNQKKGTDIFTARQLHDQGVSNVEIGNRLGITEGTVRNYLKEGAEDTIVKQQRAVNTIRQAVDKYKYVDVGIGVEKYLDIKEESLKAAIRQLQNEGYELRPISVKQVGTNHETTVKILCPPGTDYREVYNNTDKIKSVVDFETETKTASQSSLGLIKPESISSKRIFVRYLEDGGKDKDGIIELRKGVEDLSLGGAAYAQVRIAVDGTHYLKGVAMYSDHVPEGYDIILNSNKRKEDGPYNAMKKLKTLNDETKEINWENPFGSAIKKNVFNDDGELIDGGQSYYISKDGKKHLSAINKVNEEGDWENWSKTLSAQFLSKQSPDLIRTQLRLSLDEKKAELAEIQSVTNPTVKRELLYSFAEDCDASAVHLKATNLPRQSSKVILPLNDIKDNEIYAPSYKQGEKVALIRYPHGGTFEIPILTVNNELKEGKSLLGDITDAVGIGHAAAAKLSGADFDGDTVTVIPINSRVHIDSMDTPVELKGWDDKMGDIYATHKTDRKDKDGNYIYENNSEQTVNLMKNKTKQTEMGKATNLIMDMTLKGANTDEIVRATKHSMVVIDAEKHELDYKQSYIDQGIAELKKKYQGHIDPETGRLRTGAGTIITRAKSDERVLEKGKYPDIDPETGELVYTTTGKTYTTTDKKGNVVEKQRLTKSHPMLETNDARTLMSTYGTGMAPNAKELMYANYANSLKALANKARKESLSIKDNKENKSAKITYAEEVNSLNSKLNEALKNAPRERLAQIIANNTVKQQVKDNPSIKEDNDKYKKLKGQALNSARTKVGAAKQRVQITDKEWQAIQAGAVSATTLKKIINNSDSDRIRDLATPKNKYSLSIGQVMNAKALYQSGNYTLSELSEMFDVSSSTLSKLIKSA